MTVPIHFKWIPALLIVTAIGVANAKLPLPSAVDPQKAAEAKTQADDAAKQSKVLLEKYQDRAVERYKQQKGSQTDAKPVEKKL